MTGRLATLAVLLGSMTAVASAQDSYPHGRVLSVEPGVTLQRASEPGSEEAAPNLPFLPGDRVWTDRAGRAEFQFADGSLLRLDSGSKLDYVAHEDVGDGRVILRLWSGGLYLRARDDGGRPDFAVETPAGVVEARVRGLYRLDAKGDGTRLSVHEGEAALLGEREVLVRAGETVEARQGEPVDDAQAFDRAALDDFDRWNADREDRPVYAAGQREYLPAVVSPYAGELDSYGAWYYESEIGHVWRPYVAAGWRPYYDGRWAWTSLGWTWVAAEPWGWAPFHYGRWGYAPMLGWYWIPGTAWAPAWVSWMYGSDYVGWCPLGYRDKPALLGARRADRAVPRGSLAVGDEPWVYVRRADFGASDLVRRIQHTVPAGEEMHAPQQAHARPDHDLHAGLGGTPAHATPRTVKARPDPGDAAAVPRADTAVTFPTARRTAAPPRARTVHPVRTLSAPEPAVDPARAGDGRPAEPRPAEGEREVLRRVFGPLSQPRPAEPAERSISHPLPSAESERSSHGRARTGETAHPAPQRVEPRPARSPAEATQRPATPDPAQGAARPQKDRDH
jgi:uncharacterized protein DUF6600/FecR-like protein